MTLDSFLADSCDPTLPGCHPHPVQEYWPLLVAVGLVLVLAVAFVTLVVVLVVRHRRRQRNSD